MILSFKKQFQQPILDGIKIHTIRADKPNRWKEGNKIHFATGVRTKNYNCFKEGVCVSVESITIEHYKEPISGKPIGKPLISIDGMFLEDDLLNDLAKNDGFEHINDFFEWFDTDFEGKIIHWTDFKY